MRLVAAVALIATAVTGCTTPSTGGLGRCPDDGSVDDSVGVEDRLFRPDLTWLSAFALQPGGSTGDNEHEITARAARPLAGGPAGDQRLRLHDDVFERLDEVAQHRTFVLGVLDREAVVTGVMTDGAVEFIGPCEEPRLTKPLRSFATAAGITVEMVLRDLAADPRGATAGKLKKTLTPPTPVPWAQRDPRTRQIDLAETPREIVNQLVPVSVVFDLPTTWHSSEREVGLCGRLDIAWVECTSHRASAEPGPIAFTFSTIPGKGLELWLLDADGDMSAPIGRLAVIDAHTTTRARAGATLRFVPRAGVQTLEDFIASARAGNDPLIAG